MDHRQLEQLTEKVGSRYKLATLVMKRMRELQRGAPPLIENAGGLSLEKIVIREILEDKVELLIGAEAVTARKKLLINEPDSTPVQWTDNLFTGEA